MHLYQRQPRLVSAYLYFFVVKPRLKRLLSRFGIRWPSKARTDRQDELPDAPAAHGAGWSGCASYTKPSFAEAHEFRRIEARDERGRPALDPQPDGPLREACRPDGRAEAALVAHDTVREARPRMSHDDAADALRGAPLDAARVEHLAGTRPRRDRGRTEPSQVQGLTVQLKQQAGNPSPAAISMASVIPRLTARNCVSSTRTAP